MVFVNYSLMDRTANSLLILTNLPELIGGIKLIYNNLTIWPKPNLTLSAMSALSPAINGSVNVLNVDLGTASRKLWL